ncbi:Regulator of chromosome condensation (RCC1) family protein [Rhynchospora pubera]|uniref:Regulator of chromosome condensation (RCC1) family protein n=1 Tax=Rhynchospora pubera TaxID=906938 RepID=A0AAV8CH53_9POAL|nr:Regulator of chromosome condensation (RCC1) family protein [Rhynchospora pubera]
MEEVSSSKHSGSGNETKEDDAEAGEEVWGFSWGAGTDGQLGTGSFQDEHLPQPLRFSAPLSISHIACGGAHSIALTCDGRVLSWGRSDHGQLGHGDLDNCGKPKFLKFFEGFKLKCVSAGWSHSAFVADTGCLFMCGTGSFGQLGNGEIQSCNVPSEVTFFKSKHVEVEEIACGMRHTLALANGNRVYGFGSNRYGQVGNIAVGAQKSCKFPELADGFENCKVQALFANGDHSAALTDNGQLYIWGRAFTGKINYLHPRIVPSSLKFSQVALGWHHVVLLSDGEVYMMGNYRHVQHSGSASDIVPDQSFPSLTTGANENSPLLSLEKVKVLKGERVVQIASGAEHSALLTDKGSVMTWGWGEHGQLGLGDACDQALPQTVNLEEASSLATVRLAVYCGSGFTIVTR